MGSMLIEPCESRRLFSAMSPAPLIASPALSTDPSAIHAQTLRQPTALSLDLQGSISGAYTLKQPNPDAGLTFRFQGNGNLTPLSALHLQGNVVSAGNIADGQSNGILKLRIAGHGVITLNVIGPSQWGITPVPDVFNFTVKAGTGEYAKATGTGYIAFSRTPLNKATGRAVARGTFSMSFLKFPPP